jgi:trigger factor
MKTELLGQEKNLVRIKVEFEAEEFAASLSKAIQEMMQKVNIPGFRKGHVPRKILEMRFGRERLYVDSFEKMLPEAVDKIMNDYDLEAIAPPSLEKREEIHEGEPVVCELAFEVTPEVSLPELGDIRVKKLRPKLTDEEFEEAIGVLRRSYSTLTPVQRPIREGDVVSTTAVVSVAGFGGKPEPQETVVDLGNPQLRSEIKNALLGKTQGEKVSVEFVLESTYQDKRLAGKKLHDDITIDKIEERILPEVTKEFYKRVLKIDLDSQEAFREELRKQLLRNIDETHLDDAILSAVEQIVKKSELEIPDTLVNRQIELQKQQDEEACKQRFNVSLEEYLRDSSVPLALYERGVLEKSKIIIRQTLVLDAIRKKFDIEVSREDLEAEIARMANAYQTRPESIKAVYYKDQDQLKRLASELRYAKIAKVLQGKIKIEDVDKLDELPARTPQAEETTQAEAAETPSADTETTERGE